MSFPSQKVSPLLQWFVDAGIMRFDLAVQRRDAAGLAKEFLAPRHTLAEQLEVDCVESRLAWLRAENARNCDIYFRPFRRQAWPVVFLDDLPPRIALKIGGKYRAAVIETSTGRCHLWLVTTRSLDEDERTVVQRDLVARLQGAADPGSVSGDHWGRLPGFRNHKPGRDCWVNLLALTKANPYSPSLDPPISTPTRPKAHHPPCKPIAKPDGDGVDMSRLEWGWVCGCLESGLPSSWVLDQLIERARARRGDKDAIRYARHTVAKACRILGHSPC